MVAEESRSAMNGALQVKASTVGHSPTVTVMILPSTVKTMTVIIARRIAAGLHKKNKQTIEDYQKGVKAMANIMRMGQAPGYLGSWDLEDCPNREITLTIEKIIDEEVVAAGQKEICTAIHWTDKSFKPMIANVTNKKTLCKLYKTTDTEKLKGKAVTIGIEKVRAFGDVYDALRIRPKVPVQPKAGSLPKCESCGKNINAASGMAPDQVAAYTKKKYGKCLCSECATALNNKGAQG